MSKLSNDRILELFDRCCCFKTTKLKNKAKIKNSLLGITDTDEAIRIVAKYAGEEAADSYSKYLTFYGSVGQEEIFFTLLEDYEHFVNSDCVTEVIASELDITDAYDIAALQGKIAKNLFRKKEDFLKQFGIEDQDHSVIHSIASKEAAHLVSQKYGLKPNHQLITNLSDLVSDEEYEWMMSLGFYKVYSTRPVIKERVLAGRREVA